MDDLSAADIDDLARMVNGFGQRTRLAILLGFAYDNSTTEIAEVLGITRAGLTNHLEQMVDARLLRSAGKGYELTPLGRYFFKMIEAEKGRALDAWHEIDITRHHVGERLAEEVNMEFVSDEHWEEALETQLWEEVEPTLEELLFTDTKLEDRVWDQTASLHEQRLGKALDELAGYSDIRDHADFEQLKQFVVENPGIDKVTVKVGGSSITYLGGDEPKLRVTDAVSGEQQEVELAG